MTSATLAEELEVVPRTILRDVDAMTEAGLPIVVHQGNRGGIELGFNYRTRLTGLAADEAEAMAVILSHPVPALKDLGMKRAADRARSKLIESFPDGVRQKVQAAQSLFQFTAVEPSAVDPRIEAFVKAIRNHQIVRINARSRSPRVLHPIGLTYSENGWAVVDAQHPDSSTRIDECGDLNISAKRFDTAAH
jgi:predicted DNA-binding transcriptional regulator YafY